MVGASTEVATAVAVVSVNGDANQRGISFDSGSAATARHRMWPIVMSAASAKYGGGAFRMDGPGPVAPYTSPTPFDDVPKYVEPTPTPAPAPAPAPAPSPQTQTQGGVGDRTLEPRDDEGRGGGRGR